MTAPFTMGCSLPLARKRWQLPSEVWASFSTWVTIYTIHGSQVHGYKKVHVQVQVQVQALSIYLSSLSINKNVLLKKFCCCS